MELQIFFEADRTYKMVFLRRVEGEKNNCHIKLQESRNNQEDLSFNFLKPDVLETTQVVE